MDDSKQCTPTTPSAHATPPPPSPAPPPESAAPGGAGGPVTPPSRPPGGAPEPALPAEISEDWIVFRESFLFYFDPAKREVLRAAGEILFTQVLSGDQYRRPEPWPHARLRSLALDLRFAEQLLAEVADEPSHSHPEHPDETRLAQEARSWAEQAARLARTIEETIGRPPGAGQEAPEE